MDAKYLIAFILFFPFMDANADRINFLTDNPNNPEQRFIARVMSLNEDIIHARFEHDGNVSFERIHVSRIKSIYFDGQTIHSKTYKIRKSVADPVRSRNKLRTLYITEEFTSYDSDCELFGSGQSYRTKGNILTLDHEKGTLGIVCRKSEGDEVHKTIDMSDIVAWIR